MVRYNSNFAACKTRDGRLKMTRTRSRRREKAEAAAQHAIAAKENK